MGQSVLSDRRRPFGSAGKAGRGRARFRGRCGSPRLCAVGAHALAVRVVCGRGARPGFRAARAARAYRKGIGLTFPNANAEMGARPRAGSPGAATQANSETSAWAPGRVLFSL